MHEKSKCLRKIESMKGTTRFFVFGLLNLAAVALGKPHISGKNFDSFPILRFKYAIMKLFSFQMCQKYWYNRIDHPNPSQKFKSLFPMVTETIWFCTSTIVLNYRKIAPKNIATTWDTLKRMIKLVWQSLDVLVKKWISRFLLSTTLSPISTTWISSVKFMPFLHYH